MIYSFSLISLIIIVHHFSISNASPLVDDKMLIAFMNGHQETQISEYSMQKYEAHLGILYFMRKYWHCNKIADEFEEYERTECQKYRKYLDILYEYLSREYAGIPKVKPIFVVKKEFEINGPIIYAVNSLVKISQFFFNADEGHILLYHYKLYVLFYYNFEPKLLNEERLKYKIKLENEPKLLINEMILQLAIDTANEWQTNENLDGIIRQNFDANLEDMLKKVEERAKKENPWKANEINDVKHWIIINSKFDDQWTWTEDAFFAEFVKGLATNFEKFFRMAKEYSNYLRLKKEKGNIFDYDGLMISFGLFEIEKMKGHITQRYKAHLGLVYLMKENWRCEKIGKEFKEKCQKYRKHLDILHEYLFRLYAEAKNPKVTKQLQFIIVGYSLIDVVKYLNEISKPWQANDFYEMNLVNVDELKSEIKEKKTGDNASKNETEKIIAELRKEFEQKMEKQCKNTKENAKTAKDKLKKAISETKNHKEKADLENEYDDKFGTFNSSPFL